MKQFSILCLLFCITTGGVFAEETMPDDKGKKMALGLEWNMNSRDNFGAGAVAGIRF